MLSPILVFIRSVLITTHGRVLACSCPGLIRTEMVESFPPERLQHFEAMKQRFPIPRAGMPEEAAEAYIYSMRAGYTTGQVLYVEGGALLTS
jgi:NAD(P)-dependent dehydrogenase (short-subunit alcohol dehydrogenase family)